MGKTALVNRLKQETRCVIAINDFTAAHSQGRFYWFLVLDLPFGGGRLGWPRELELVNFIFYTYERLQPKRSTSYPKGKKYTSSHTNQ